MKEKAKDMIDELSDLGNVSVNLVQFSTLGDYIQEEFVDLKSGSGTIKQNIQNMKPDGGTNPGDGLRHAMVSLQKNPAQFKYVVLLTDGVPNLYTVGQYRDKWQSSRYIDVFNYDGPEFDLSDNVDANYYDASNQEELAKVFSDIKKQIEQDLWFVVGP
ncbi:vWA domain-containing protein [Streptococcus sp. X13SY08]|uniref:vWA domain-containing protein n=1 Tax=unclassified Streptococcus TaxID=2608887 RepID=UPI002E805879|nr:vWA domain-containing protein [Streptococcus sp. X13SY08]